MLCVRCGKEATEGSMKFPFCEKCFRKEFNSNNAALLQLEKMGR